MKLSYLSYFFTYETHIPDGIGFALFGPWHLLWLSVIFAICVRYVWIYKKGDERKKRRMDGLTACSLVVWIVVRAIYIAVIHEAFLYELPFHLCSMAGILCVVHCLTKWKWLGAVYHLSPGNSAGTFISKLELLSGHSFHYTGRLFVSYGNCTVCGRKTCIP